MYPWSFLLDPTTFLLLAIASGTILYGSHRSLSYYKGGQVSENNDDTEVRPKTVFILPIVGSVVLVGLFYYMNYVYYLLVVLLAFASTTGVAFCIYPLFEWAFVKLKRNRSWNIRWIGYVDVAGIASTLFAMGVVAIWVVFINSHSIFFLTDILALCLAVSALSSVRLPNLMISTLLLSLFFVYDIFWVFISQYIFSKNVMVTVAKSLPTLPMEIILPRFLDDGESLLGLGDIVLPGIFLCFLHRFDYFNNIPFKRGYFLFAWIGYILGLCVTYLMVFAFQAGQPALLYLVPGTLLPTYIIGWKRGHLRDLWKGLYAVDETSGVDMSEDQVSLLQEDGNEV